MNSVRMTAERASVLKALLLRGLSQHHAAAMVGVNGGRAAEVATGQRYADVAPANDHLIKQTVDQVLAEYRRELA